MNIFDELDKTLKKALIENISKTGNISHDENIDILVKDGYLKSIDGGKFRMTNLGKLFIKQDGYYGENCKKRRADFLQYGFWIANIFSLVVAICALTNNSKNNCNHNLNLVVNQDTLFKTTIDTTLNAKDINIFNTVPLKFDIDYKEKKD